MSRAIRRNHGFGKSQSQGADSRMRVFERRVQRLSRNARPATQRRQGLRPDRRLGTLHR